MTPYECREGGRLDVFLSQAADITRSRAGALIREGRAKVNGSVQTKAGYELKPGDRVL
ncbi:MAG: rRNA pseudouridine synthase, partial [Clostridia bacterium]|nr:rRNA pseudouridine synthase [Clostridia bacterium]